MKKTDLNAVSQTTVSDYVCENNLCSWFHSKEIPFLLCFSLTNSSCFLLKSSIIDWKVKTKWVKLGQLSNDGQKLHKILQNQWHPVHAIFPVMRQVWRLKKVKTLINYYFWRKEKQNQKEKKHYNVFQKGQGCILPKKIIFGGKGKESDPNSLSVDASAIV